MIQQVVEAVTVLYPSQNAGAQASATSKDEALSWLTQWQESQQAWLASIELLGHENYPQEALFIASQTLRTKVLLDFTELPPADRAQFRDAVLEKLEKLSADTAICTQLCMCVADLVIHMDEQWPNAIGFLLTKWKTEEHFPLLLEVLEYLPEESGNKRLLIDQVRRKKTTIALEGKALEILQLLHSMWRTETPVKILSKIMRCFHSWLCFLGGDKSAEEIMLPCDVLMRMLDPLVKDCFHFLDKNDMGETATDIIVQVIRICSINLQNYSPVAQNMMVNITLLKDPLGTLLQNQNLNGDQELYLRRLCRIFTETGESLVPIIVDAPSNPDAQSLVKVLVACSDCSILEISSIPLEQFWFRLARCVADHPDDAKRQEFKPIFFMVLGVLIKRTVIPLTEDPFTLDQDFQEYRRQLRQVAFDITYGSKRKKQQRAAVPGAGPPQVALHPNEAMEFVLQSLLSGGAATPAEQEAHFFILNALGGLTDVTQESALWNVLTHLPTLINTNAVNDGRSVEEKKRVQFTKKTAMLLLGSLSKWVQQRPEFLRSTLSMISTILLSKGDGLDGKERDVVLAEAAQSFAEVAMERHGSTVVLGQVKELCQLYRATLGTMPVHLHLFIVEGVAQTVQRVPTDEEFKTYMSELITPLLEEFNNAEVCNNAATLTGILDRLTTIIRYAVVAENTARAEVMGRLIAEYVWPTTQKIFAAHQANSNVVEKTCRLLKHSIRCVPALCKPIVQPYAETLVKSFASNQHSTYLYAAEILVNTYGDDADCKPILESMFNSLSATGVSILVNHDDFNKATELGELVEDFFGMFDRFLKYTRDIVLSSTTLEHALNLCVKGLFTIQREAIEAVVALIENIYCCATPNGTTQNTHARIKLQQWLMQVTPLLLMAVFEVLKGVPPQHVVYNLHGVLKAIRKWASHSANQEFPQWLNDGLRKLPPSVLNSIDNLHGQLASCKDEHLAYYTNDIAYRCEQVYLRSRNRQ
eukprot:GEMP01007289.1.p1 GENE.GEMP01007289.1~~GEMP01007289.1.p1  ORF type:complete len:995 (+),score=195.02 GEMP01007289.1:31-2985(+)